MPRKKKSDMVVQDVPEVDSGAAAEAPAPADPPAGSSDVGLSRIVVFKLGDQQYGVPIDSVQEIQQIVELTPVPDLSPALVGMLDVRGFVVPAIDLRLLLGMESKEYHLDTPMVLLRCHGHLVALVVDEVEDVYELPEGCMQAPSRLYAMADRMIGICRLDIGLVVVLDPDRLVPDSMIVAVSSGAEAEVGV
ncbi:MAG: chemotaxis protein CheW [Coriobacteriia bacterium]